MIIFSGFSISAFQKRKELAYKDLANRNKSFNNKNDFTQFIIQKDL